jgi:hypothetical protein
MLSKAFLTIAISFASLCQSKQVSIEMKEIERFPPTIMNQDG